MTPDQVLTLLQVQRTDLAAMRVTMADLAQCMESSLHAKWMDVLRARIAALEAETSLCHPEKRMDLQAKTNALENLYHAFSKPEPTSQAD